MGEPQFVVIPMAIGDAFSDSFARGNAGFLILAGDEQIMLDCPPLVGALLKQASRLSGVPATLAGIGHVLVTHLHDDHSGGLSEYTIVHATARNPLSASQRRYSAAEQAAALRYGRPTLHGHPHLVKHFWQQKLKIALGQSYTNEGDFQENQVGDWFYTQSLTPGHRFPLGDSGVEVEARYTVHHIPCAAYKLFFNGRSVGFSGDAHFEPALIDWLANCDLVFHESTYGPGHTDLDQLREYVMARPALAAKLYVYHYPSTYDLKRCPLKFAQVGKPHSV